MMGEENRKSRRSKTYAKVLLQGGAILGYLRDLSRDGCQLAFIADPGIQKGSAVTIEVLPAEEMQIPRFSVAVQIMWTRNDSVFHIAGGLITSAQNKERLEELLRYYA